MRKTSQHLINIEIFLKPSWLHWDQASLQMASPYQMMVHLITSCRVPCKLTYSGERKLVWITDCLKSCFCYFAGQMARHLFHFYCFTTFSCHGAFIPVKKTMSLLHFKWLYSYYFNSNQLFFVLCNYYLQISSASYLLFQMLKKKCCINCYIHIYAHN